MNSHFTHEDFLFDRPERLYARLDHVEVGVTSTLFALDGVDAEWVDNNRTSPYFNMDDLATMTQKWELFWGEFEVANSPLNGMPVFRVEFDVPHGPTTGTSAGEGAAWPDELLGAAETLWVEVELDEPAVLPVPAKLYHGMFLAPTPVSVRIIFPLPAKVSSGLSTIFSLSQLPVASQADMTSLMANVHAELLAIYDVGQGNANALLNSIGQATLFFDLGCGVYRNLNTTPNNLWFCWCGNASTPIVLSHWDADHWAGAYWSRAKGITCTALTKQWLVPLQTVTPQHMAVVNDILSNGGQLHLFTSAVGAPYPTSLGSGHKVSLICGSGSSRNHSGIVMLVEDTTQAPQSWILTGDCDYKYFITTLTISNLIAVVAPHHGAKPSPGSMPPAPTTGAYKRILYSFGPGNIHGPAVRHPTIACVNAHAAWNHGTWLAATPPIPGDGVAGAEALATACHQTPFHLESAVVGWTPPGLPMPACPAKSKCTTVLTQS